jgi:vancomycin resistance protein YoaR
MISNLGRNKKIYNITGIVFFLLILINVAFYNFEKNKLSYKYFYQGVYVDGINISGMTKEEALLKLKNHFYSHFTSKSVSLIFGEKKWTIPLEDIDYRYDFDMTLDYAYNIGREGSFVNRLKTIKSIKKRPVNLFVSVKFNGERILEKLKKIKRQLDFPGISSTYDYNYGKISCTSEVAGKLLDIDLNANKIYEQLQSRNFNDIYLTVQTVKPLITIADVKDIKDILGSYTTNFNANNSSRVHNVSLASKKINNYLLLPGEEFSMDVALGPRTADKGFMQAPIISKNTVVSGTGGGVCQVASTLYNSVLLSRLQVTSRVNHSITLGYVPPGRDATISEGYIDFKFKNNRDYTICIVSEVNSGCLTVKIIGKKRADDPVVKLRSIIVQEYEPPEPEYAINENLKDGEINIRVKEKKGLKVVLYRDTYNSEGALINSEKISQDIYKPVRGVCEVNRKYFEYVKKAN